jgi:hypothetical protein
MPRPIALLALVLAVLASCESRPPLARAQVAAIADNTQREFGLNWGDPDEVLPPETGVDGHRWWQVRYRTGADGALRLILVDHDSGWGRLPPEGYAPRITPARPAPSASAAATAPALAEGSWLLVLEPHAQVDGARAGELAREAMRLNALAAGNGLYPAFTVHQDRAGRQALVYGWQGDRGMARDERVAEWVRLRTAYAQAAWLDLLR